MSGARERKKREGDNGGMKYLPFHCPFSLSLGIIISPTRECGGREI
jgi:hypothetical protein